MNVAILIDAENVLPGHADLIFAHAGELGDIVCKEIYGAASALTTWVAPVLKYAIHPNLTIKAAKGKNSSDIALVIGAMDLLVTGGIDTAIIASSDSDFSSLSVRLRNAGIQVVGMGTEKANALWRTACSSFVVLQNQKPAQPARQSQAQPARQQTQTKAEALKAPEPAAGSTHKERVDVISQAITRLLESSGGKAQVSTLFPSLNRLREYKVDRQGSGKRPLNYLTSTYGSAFHFEEMPDGQAWVFLPGVPVDKPAAQAESPAREQAREAAPPVEAAPEAGAPAAPAPGVPEGDGADPGEGYVTPQQISDRLVAGGFEEEIAQQVTGIFADSASYRAAYNRLRSVFGNTAGREYYQRAKQILSDGE